jgi:hypothetical protein
MLLLGIPVLAQYSTEQLGEDIEKVARVVAADERGYVTNYLRKGSSGLGGGDVLTAMVARNALNKLKLDQNGMRTLARLMWSHAQSTNFPTDTRQYGFSTLTHLAGRNQEADVLVRSLAEKIVKSDQDSLKRAAERFLRQNDQPPPESVRSLTPSQLVGRWRHVDAMRRLATDITFRQDGTYTGGVEVEGKAKGSFSGKWALKEGILHYEYTASSDKHIPVGAKDQDRIIELTKDRYTIENTLGLRETYVRKDD